MRILENGVKCFVEAGTVSSRGLLTSKQFCLNYAFSLGSQQVLNFYCFSKLLLVRGCKFVLEIYIFRQESVLGSRKWLNCGCSIGFLHQKMMSKRLLRSSHLALLRPLMGWPWWALLRIWWYYKGEFCLPVLDDNRKLNCKGCKICTPRLHP